MWLAIGLNVAFNFSFCGAISASDREGLTFFVFFLGFFSSNALIFKVLMLPRVLGLNASIRTGFNLALEWKPVGQNTPHCTFEGTFISICIC